jgi:hypothetical protein
VLGHEDRGGISYGRVSVTATCSSEGQSTSCSRVFTDTWIIEGGKWRRLALPAMRDLCESKMQSGDYTGVRAAAEQWLQVDPFSVQAYKEFLFALERGAAGSRDSDLSIAERRADALRTLLVINPNDSTVLFLAATSADSKDIARTFLDRMPGDACRRPSAIFNVALEYRDGRERLSFLDDYVTDDVGVSMLRAVASGKAGRRADFQNLMTAEREAAVRKSLDAEDPSFAASWAAALGDAFVRTGCRDGGRRWLEYGLGRDPTDEDLSQLARQLR